MTAAGSAPVARAPSSSTRPASSSSSSASERCLCGSRLPRKGSEELTATDAELVRRELVAPGRPAVDDHDRCAAPGCALHEPEPGHHRERGARHQERAVLVGERSEEHTSELQSLIRISYAVFCLTKKKTHHHMI